MCMSHKLGLLDQRVSKAESNGLPILRFDNLEIGDILEHFRVKDPLIKFYSNLTAQRNLLRDIPNIIL